MLVQCPNCKTTYKVSDDVLKGATPAFRCSRCRHTFELEADEPVEPTAGPVDAPPDKNPPPAEDRELSFSFPAKEPPPPTDVERLAARESAPFSPAPIEPDSRDDDHWSLHANVQARPAEERPFTLPEPDRPAFVDQPQAASDPIPPMRTRETVSAEAEAANGAPNILPMSSYADQQASIMPYLTLFALLVIGYGLAAVVTYAHPKSSEDWLKKIPLFGSAVLKNSHLKDGILLQSLRGGYLSIQGNREVFVITGTAVNQNPVVIREIQLTGKIRNEAGKELEEQTVWVGNTLSGKILRGMTLEDIPHLQSLKPLKSFEMPPGDSVPFTVVFLKASRFVKDFTCVVSFADSDS